MSISDTTVLKHEITSMKLNKCAQFNMQVCTFYLYYNKTASDSKFHVGCHPFSNQHILLTVECTLDTVQDFLIKLGIKPCLHILKISILH